MTLTNLGETAPCVDPIQTCGTADIFLQTCQAVAWSLGRCNTSVLEVLGGRKRGGNREVVTFGRPRVSYPRFGDGARVTFGGRLERNPRFDGERCGLLEEVSNEMIARKTIFRRYRAKGRPVRVLKFYMCPQKLSYKSVPQKCPTRVFSKSVPQSDQSVA